MLATALTIKEAFPKGSLHHQLPPHSLPLSVFPVPLINPQHFQLPHLIPFLCMFPQIFTSSRFSAPSESYSLELASMQHCCFSKFIVVKLLLVIPSVSAICSLMIPHQLAEPAPFFPLPFLPLYVLPPPLFLIHILCLMIFMLH